MKRKLVMILLLAVSIIFGSFGLVACGESGYSIKFMIDGKVYATVSSSGNEEIELPEDPVKPNYTFDGWFVDDGTFEKEFTAQYLVDKTLDADLSVYSKWTAKTSEFEGSSLVSISGMTVVEETKKVSAGVSNATESFSFADKTVEVSEGAGWILSLDLDGNEVIENKLLTLEEGDNIAYIIVTSGNGLNSTTYTVNVYRNKMFRVKFDAKGGSPVKDQLVEEGKKATEPTSERAGYVLSWNFNFATPITEDITITAKWTPESEIPYKVEHYLQNVNDDNYTIDEASTESLTGTIDTSVTAHAKTFEHFTAVNEEASGNIAGDGSLVLKLYYNRDKYTVTFNGNGGEKVSGEETQQVKYEGSAVAPVYKKAGYSNSWDKELSNVSENTEITAIWTANTNTPYKVEYYLQNVENDLYALVSSETRHGTTDTIASETPKTIEHFTFTESGSVTEGEIAGDGSLVLKLYYNRDKYTVTFNGNGGEKVSGEETQQVKYEDSAVAPVYKKDGYSLTFDVSYENITGNTDVTAVWTPKNNTAYTVKYYQQSLVANGYELVRTETHYGTTGETATAEVRPLMHFAVNESESKLAGTIAGNGSLVLEVKYDREVYTVSLEKNLESGSCSGGGEYVYGAAITVTAEDVEGYTFDGWFIDDKLVTFSLTYTFKAEKNSTARATWSANTDTKYTVKYYQQKVEGDEYDLTYSDTLYGATGENVEAVVKNYDHFTLNTAASTLSGNIAGDGSLVLEVKYDREVYTVTVNKSVESGSCFGGGEYRYGKEVALTAENLEGYTFEGWFVGEEAKEYALTYTFTAEESVTITAVWKADAIGYTVKYYQQDVAGDDYTLVRTDKDLPGAMGETVEAEIVDYGTYFTINNEKSKTSGEIGTTGLELAVYYDRAVFTVSVDIDGSGVSLDNIFTETFRYGYQVDAVTATLLSETVEWNGWYVNGTFKTIDLTFPAFEVDANMEIRAVAVNTSVLIIDENAILTGVTDKTITEITIPANVKAIGGNAFVGCNDLAKVTIMSGVESIGAGAFKDCAALKTIVIPSTVQSIATSAFAGCAIETATVSASHVSSIKNSSLKNVTLNGGTEIPANAFNGLAELNRIYIPLSVTAIGTDAFSGCTALTSVYYEGTTKDWAKIEGLSNVMAEGRTLYVENDKAITSLDLQGVTEIKDYAFAYQTGIKTVTIPATVTTIGANAFKGCAIETATVAAEKAGYVNGISLKTLTISGGTEIPAGALMGATALTKITLPNTLETIGEHAFNGCTALTGIYFIGTANQWSKISGLSNVMSEGRTLYINNSAPASVMISGITEIKDYAFAYQTGIKTITIPASVTTIGEHAFIGCAIETATVPAEFIGYVKGTSLVTLTVNSGTEIPANALSGATALTQVTLPTSITTIGDGALMGASALTKITIPAGVTSIGENAFSGCTALTGIYYLGTVNQWAKISGLSNVMAEGRTLYIGNSAVTTLTISGITEIKDYAFAYQTTIKTVIIPESVTTIGEHAFIGCAIETATVPAELIGYVKGTSLVTLTISSGTEIPANALSGATALTQVNIPATVTTIGANAFKGCTALTTVLLPSAITSIGESAFENTALTQVTIPASVKTIGTNAFKGITALTTVTWNATNCTAAGTSDAPIFNGSTNINKVTFGTSITNIPAFAFKGLSKLTSVTIPATITTIGESAFANTGLTAITVPASVTSIGENAFGAITALTTINWNATNISTAGTSAAPIFNGSTNVNKLNIASAVTNIPAYAFKDLGKVTAVTLPSGLKTVGTYAFANTGITSVTITSSITGVAAYAFGNCSSLKTVTIESGASGINANAFAGSAIENAEVPADYISYIANSTVKNVTVTSGTAIPANAFDGCASLSSVSIPASVTSIGNYAFKGCTSLTSITLANGITSIGTYAFTGCTKLTNVSLPSTIKTISANMFNGCSALVEINIPTSVTSIATGAFTGCTKLARIKYAGTASKWAITEIKDYAFAYQTKLTTVNIEDSITTIGENAFLNCSALTAFNLDGFAKSKTTGKSSGTTNWMAIKGGAPSVPTITSASEDYTKITGLTEWNAMTNYTNSVLTDGLSVYFKANSLSSGSPRIGFSFVSKADGYGPQSGLFSAIIIPYGNDYYALFYANSHDNNGTNIGYRNFDGTNFSGTDYGTGGLRCYGFTRDSSMGFKLTFERIGNKAYKVTIANVIGLVAANSYTVYVPSEYVPDNAMLSVWGMGSGNQNMFVKVEYIASMTGNVTFKANSLKNTSALKAITVSGSIEHWQTMTKTSGWNTGSGITNVICDEGTLDINTTYAVKNGKIYIKPSDKTIQLIQDPEFKTGLSVGSTTMNDASIYGRLDYNGKDTYSKYYDYWKLSQWHAAPSIVNTSTGAVNGTYTVSGNTHTYSNDAKVIRVNQDKKEIYLEIDTRKVQASGGSTTSDHPHHLIEKEFSYSPKFSELSALRLSFKFKVERFDNVGYNGGQAAQCSWYFYLTNSDHSQTMFFGFNCYDNRWDYYGKNQAEKQDSVSWEQNVGNAVVKMGRDRWANFGNSNRVSVGTEYTVSIDVFAMLDAGLNLLKNKYSQYNVSRNDLHIGSFNWGWEMPNIKTAAGIAISDISVLATYK